MHVMFGHQHMSVMESQFPKPLEYIPERWLDKDNPLYHKNTHPFAFSPWGFGVRMCAGAFFFLTSSDGSMFTHTS